MILQDVITTTNINVDTTQYSIKESPVAYQILYEKLYENPYKAVIRELVTNAYDSQLKNGNPDTKIEIKLPSFTDPIFIIRDRGTGLSKTDVLDMYTTFFRSDKSHTNDYTGCFGLGSKSPFAIADSFILISYYNGKKYSFLNIKKNGYPNIFLTSEEDTTEDNGLEIRIPVKEKDIRYLKEAANYLRYIPEVKTTYEMRSTFVYSYDVFTFYSNIDSGYTNKLFIKQGQTICPITEDKYLDIIHEFGYLAREYDIVLEVPMGSLSISPSREHISDSEENKKFIISYFTTHYSKLYEHLFTLKPYDYPQLARILSTMYSSTNTPLKNLNIREGICYTGQYFHNFIFYRYDKDKDKFEKEYRLSFPLALNNRVTLILCPEDKKKITKIKRIVTHKFKIGKIHNDYWNEDVILCCKRRIIDPRTAYKIFHGFIKYFRDSPIFTTIFNVVGATKFLNQHKNYKITKLTNTNNTNTNNNTNNNNNNNKSIDPIVNNTVAKVYEYRPFDLFPIRVVETYKVPISKIMSDVANGYAILTFKNDNFNGINSDLVGTLLNTISIIKFKGRYVFYDFLRFKNPMIKSDFIKIYSINKSAKKYLNNYSFFTLNEIYWYFIDEGIRVEQCNLNPNIYLTYEHCIKAIDILPEHIKSIVYNSRWFRQGINSYALLIKKYPNLMFTNDSYQFSYKVLRAFFGDKYNEIFRPINDKFKDLPNLLYTKELVRGHMVTSKCNSYYTKQSIRKFLIQVLKRG